MLRPIQRGEIMKLLRWLYDRIIVWLYDYFFTTRLIRNNLIVTDHDKTIGYNKKSTFEEDGDLPKWRKAKIGMSKPEQSVPTRTGLLTVCGTVLTLYLDVAIGWGKYVEGW